MAANSLWKNVGQRIESLAYSKIDALAEEAQKTLEAYYEEIIKKFYSEYTPTKYVRHGMRGMTPGMSLTYEQYMHWSKDMRTVYAGIHISNDNMYDDYDESNDNVLNAFLGGWHGNYIQIPGGVLPENEMWFLRDYLFKEYENRCKLKG